MLSKDALAAGLKAAFAAGIGGASQEQVADLLAAAIDAYVRTGQVVVDHGSSGGTYPVL